MKNRRGDGRQWRIGEEVEDRRGGRRQWRIGGEVERSGK